MTEAPRELEGWARILGTASALWRRELQGPPGPSWTHWDSQGRADLSGEIPGSRSISTAGGLVGNAGVPDLQGQNLCEVW